MTVHGLWMGVPTNGTLVFNISVDFYKRQSELSQFLTN
jgi:hypothetical protein